MLVESVFGNVNEPEWRERLGTARVDDLMLDQWDAQKSRLRKQTRGGVEVALSLGRGNRLRDGDILCWDQASATAVVARIEFGDVMLIDLGGLATEPAELGLRLAVELGHAIGNQHWPAVVKGTRRLGSRHHQRDGARPVPRCCEGRRRRQGRKDRRRR